MATLLKKRHSTPTTSLDFFMQPHLTSRSVIQDYLGLYMVVFAQVSKTSRAQLTTALTSQLNEFQNDPQPLPIPRPIPFFRACIRLYFQTKRRPCDSFDLKPASPSTKPDDRIYLSSLVPHDRLGPLFLFPQIPWGIQKRASLTKMGLTLVQQLHGDTGICSVIDSRSCNHLLVISIKPAPDTTQPKKGHSHVSS